MKLLILIFSYINAFISKDSSTIIFEYEFKNAKEIVFIYNYKNEDYTIGVIKNIFDKELKDTFIWMTKQKWEGKGDLKVFVKNYDGNVDKYFISGKNLKTIDFLKKKENDENLIEIKEGHFINPSLLKTYEAPDIYAWRNAGYNPQHTNYYPFKIFPPLNLKWVKDWGEPGALITMISCAIGHNMIFITNAPDEWNVICAIDIESKKIIWKRSFISNVFTSCLCEGESLLFVGTCIGFTPDTNTTFACLDPFTGNLKWSKRGLGTVEFSPISVDTFVYVPALGSIYKWMFVHAYTLKGKLLWEKPTTGGSPGYFDKRIYGFQEENDDNPDDTAFFYCRDALNGNVLWKYNCKKAWGGGSWPTIYLKKVVFSFEVGPDDTLLALDPYTGSKLWFVNGEWQVSANDNKIFYVTAERINDTVYSRITAFSIFNGEKIWEKIISNYSIEACVAPAPPLSYSDILWANDKYIYALNIKNGEILYKSEEIFLGNSEECCMFFPILYKDYIIISRRGALSVYQGDTIPYLPPQDTISKFYIFYGDFFTPILYIYLYKKDYIFIDIFDEIGRRLKNIYKGELEPGEYRIYFDKDIKSGKYFIVLKTNKFKKNFKIIKIRR